MNEGLKHFKLEANDSYNNNTPRSNIIHVWC